MISGVHESTSSWVYADIIDHGWSEVNIEEWHLGSWEKLWEFLVLSVNVILKNIAINGWEGGNYIRSIYFSMHFTLFLSQSSLKDTKTTWNHWKIMHDFWCIFKLQFFLNLISPLHYKFYSITTTLMLSYIAILYCLELRKTIHR